MLDRNSIRIAPSILIGQRHFSLMIASLSGVANMVYDRTIELPFQ